MSLEHGTTHAPSRGDLRSMRENVQRAQLAGSVDYLAGERLLAVIDGYEDSETFRARIEAARSDLELAVDDLGLDTDTVAIGGALDDLDLTPDVRKAIETVVEKQAAAMHARAVAAVADVERRLREVLAKVERAIDGKPEPEPEKKTKKKGKTK